MKAILTYIGIILLSLFLIWKGLVPAWHAVNSDFGNYYVASRLIVENADLQKLYDNEWFQKQIAGHGIDQPGKFAPFPPITAWIMLPLTAFDPLSAQRIWTLFNIFCLGLSIYLLGKITTWNWSTATLFILFNGLGLVNNFAFGQVYLLMSTGLMLCYVLAKENKPALAGAVVGFFAAVKYFPVVFLPGYFLGHFKKMVFYACITIVLLFVLQWLIFGTEVMVEFVGHVLLPHLDGNLAGQDPFSFQFQSWDSFFRLLFVADPATNPNPPFPWSGGRIFAKIILYAVIGIFTGLVFWKARRLPAATHLPVLLSLPTLAALTLLPVSATYHFVLLVFPLALLLQPGYLEKRDRIIIFTLYVMIGFIPYRLAFYLAEKWGLIFGYPRLFLISLLWLFALTSLHRKIRKDLVPSAAV